MCDPHPGARCSADTLKELQAAEGRRATALREATEQPDDVGAQQRLQLAEEKHARKLAAYDSSPRGQSDLRAAIAAAEDPSAASVDELRTRLATGRITRVDQKRALARARGGSSDDEVREANKALRRLRHPAAPVELGETPALGFYVPTASATDRYVNAGIARAAAIAAGCSNFYDAQTGDQVALHRGEAR